ncbi:helix-turn-helix domain-containing protein [Brevibacillus thermoruber]|uniref:helix-turn-helix domain-containing protein n=1 Tax=Brevibacillus thermoruber TaxID=33942 RepID=UPI00068A0674|nr:S24 family peptidase [Brevibacillus thermoruber]
MWKEELGKRIKEIRDSVGMTQEEFAEQLDSISRGHLGKLEKGQAIPSAEVVKEICTKFNVDANWLLTGTTMRQNAHEMDDDLKNLLERIKALSSEEQEDLELVIDLLEFKRKRKQIVKEASSSYNRITALNQMRERLQEPTVRLPILGTAAAGVPITAIRFVEGYIDVPEKYKDCFVVRIKGDSMIEAGIHDGSYVVVRQQNTVENGEIALVMIREDGEEEVTIKRFRLEGGYAILISENEQFPPMRHDARNVTVLGKVVYWVNPEEAATIEEVI